uniref:Uncharacterized protein n=1 Tax=Rhizophora mucronata TaxID=61149 RepID=A0A2P2KWH8_RHIMU
MMDRNFINHFVLHNTFSCPELFISPTIQVIIG